MTYHNQQLLEVEEEEEEEVMGKEEDAADDDEEEDWGAIYLQEEEKEEEEDATRPASALQHPGISQWYGHPIHFRRKDLSDVARGGLGRIPLLAQHRFLRRQLLGMRRSARLPDAQARCLERGLPLHLRD